MQGELPEDGRDRAEEPKTAGSKPQAEPDASAALALIRALFPGWPWRGVLLSGADLGWRLGYRLLGRSGQLERGCWYSLEDIQGVLEASTRLHVPGTRLGVETVCRQASLGASGPSEDAPAALGGVVIFIGYAALFEERGPLYDPHRAGKQGSHSRRDLSAGEVKRAAKAAREQLEHVRPLPTAAVATGHGVYAFFGFREPRGLLQQDVIALERAQRDLARRLHGARALDLGATMPLPLVVTRSGKRVVLGRLLWADVGCRYEFDTLIREATEPFRDVCSPQRLKGRWRQPAIMEARTLPEGWDNSELAVLPPHVRQVLVDGRAGDEVYDERWVRSIARAVAIRRFGWLDFEALRNDDRFHLGHLARFFGYTSTGLRNLFRSALEDVSPAFPPRLPYAITSIVHLVPEDAVEGIARRVLVEGGSRLLPFSIEMTLATLMSPAKFRAVLAEHLGLMPYRVPLRVWDALIGAALRDPRITKRRKLGPSDGRRTLEDWILEYAARAKAWKHWMPPLSGKTDERWPVLHAGRACFPLRHLLAWLLEHVPGEPFKMGEVTTAIRALGGDEDGPTRFGKHTRLRCWSVSYSGEKRE